jgi:hypothetical protein
LDRSLILLGGVIVISLASAAIWHFAVKSYTWAIVGSSVTVGAITYWGYPIFRGVVPNMLIVVNALVLGAVIALGVGIPFKRGRLRKGGLSNDV